MNWGKRFSTENPGFSEKPIDSFCLPGNYGDVDKYQRVSYDQIMFSTKIAFVTQEFFQCYRMILCFDVKSYPLHNWK